MAKVSVAEIKELMKSTGVGMMDCKKLSKKLRAIQTRLSYFSVKKDLLHRQRKAEELLLKVLLHQ